MLSSIISVGLEPSTKLHGLTFVLVANHLATLVFKLLP